MRGVTAEICRDHLFDPQAAKFKLPAGYRLMLAAEGANADPSTWRATGAGIFSDALAISDDSSLFGTMFQEVGHHGLACIGSHPRSFV